MPISAENIYQWRDEERPVNLAEDIDQLWDDESIFNTFESTRAYIGYIISQNQHEDYERDSCEILVEHDGPYSNIQAEVAREVDGEEYNEDYYLSVDSLISYMASPEYVSEDMLKEFFFRYLDCFISNGDGDSDLPENLNVEFKSVIKPKLYQALTNLAQ